VVAGPAATCGGVWVARQPGLPPGRGRAWRRRPPLAGRATRPRVGAGGAGPRTAGEGPRRPQARGPPASDLGPYPYQWSWAGGPPWRMKMWLGRPATSASPGAA